MPSDDELQHYPLSGWTVEYMISLGGAVVFVLLVIYGLTN